MAAQSNWPPQSVLHRAASRLSRLPPARVTVPSNCSLHCHSDPFHVGGSSGRLHPVVFVFLTSLVVGPHLLISSLVLRQQIKSQLVIVGTQGLVAIIFPVASTVFYRVSAIQQTAFVFVAPVLKFIARQIIAKAAEGLHEYIGLIVVFSVDLFSVFYVAICMQTSKSAITTVLMIVSDSFHLVVALRAIFQQVHGVKPVDES